MKSMPLVGTTVVSCFFLALPARGQQCIEVSDDGHEMVVVRGTETDGTVTVRGRSVPYGSTPDWQNDLRRQVGGLQAEDMNGDGLIDVVVGCYYSDSYPPYEDWENLIYYNVGGELEASPSWISTDEVSTGDVQVADINDDTYPDIFAANGGYSMSASVIYWGSPSGPSLTPGWFSAEPLLAWNNYAMPFDFDHDGDIDVVTANQGNSPEDAYRPIYVFFNTDGVLSTTPGWQSAEWSIQNFLAFADYEGNGWEDLAVSKWSGFESGIYRNVDGVLLTVPQWTTGDTDSDKGVAWADVDANDWPDLALGHDPTLLYDNVLGVLTVGWSSSATYFGHSDLRFCDVDRDGDQDLAETHFSDGKVHIYLNDDGVLESAPSWTYDSPTVGTAIAFGDINGDNWPDLIVGNSGDPSVKVFYAQPTGVPGDFDGDLDVDGDDYAQFASCFTGPGGGPLPPGCLPGDFDADDDIDCDDWAEFVLAWTEPGDPPELPECSVAAPLEAGYPDNIRRNRYIQFDPNPANAGRNVAFKVTLTSMQLNSCDDNGWPCQTDDHCRVCSGSGEPCWTAPIHCPSGETCDLTGASCVQDHAGSVGMSWWVGAQHPTTGVHLIVSEPYRKVSAAWPNPVTAGDCEIVPVAVYKVAAVNVDTGFEGPALEVGTIFKPLINRPWADCTAPLADYCTGNWRPCSNDGDCPVCYNWFLGPTDPNNGSSLTACTTDADCPEPGEFCGTACIEQWPPPDGFPSFMDISAAVFTFSQVPGFTVTKIENLDLHGNDAGDATVDPPNYKVNFDDIGWMIKAFQGYPYPFNDPGDCPDVAAWPP